MGFMTSIGMIDIFNNCKAFVRGSGFIRSGPVGVTVVSCFSALHAGLPVLIAQAVSHSVSLSSSRKQTSVVASSSDVFDGIEHQQPEGHHALSGPLIIPSPADSSL